MQFIAYERLHETIMFRKAIKYRVSIRFILMERINEEEWDLKRVS